MGGCNFNLFDRLAWDCIIPSGRMVFIFRVLDKLIKECPDTVLPSMLDASGWHDFVQAVL